MTVGGREGQLEGGEYYESRYETMKKLKGGWVEGSVQEFLDLSNADMEYVETKLALSRRLQELRSKKYLTQTTLTAAFKTSQSRVAKMEKGDPTESINKSVPVPPTRGFGY